MAFKYPFTIYSWPCARNVKKYNLHYFDIRKRSFDNKKSVLFLYCTQ